MSRSRKIGTNCEIKQFFHEVLLKFRKYQQFLIQLLGYGRSYRQTSVLGFGSGHIIGQLFQKKICSLQL
jgi:hypothetical protein